MVDLSLSQAARLTGRSKSTIGRAIKSGRLSASRNEDGTFGINPAELLRAFPKDAPEPVQHRPASGSRDRDETAELRARLAVAEALAEERARALEAAERNLADLRRILPSLAPVVTPVPATEDPPTWPKWKFWK
jgi:hypothetical protein